MKRISGIIVAIFLTLVMMPMPTAQALGGNFECDTQNVDGAYPCMQTFVRHIKGRKYRLKQIDVWAGGNRSTLEGGCGDSPAIDIRDLRVKSPRQTTIWGPKEGAICKEAGYVKSYAIKGVVIKCDRPGSPGSWVRFAYKLNDNGGRDKADYYGMDAETCGT